MSRKPLVRILGSLLSVALATACTTDVPANNPYDPEIPEHQKVPSAISGTVVLESGDPTVATVEVRPVGRSPSRTRVAIFASTIYLQGSTRFGLARQATRTGPSTACTVPPERPSR